MNATAGNCLMLNASFEPLRVIGLRRAVVLIMQEKAEVIETAGDGMIRSANTEWPLPSVIRLRAFVKLPFRAKVPLNRRSLIARDRGACQVLGCEKVGNTIDHIVPRSRGGKHDWMNVTLMCQAHNAKKADMLLSELGWELKREPTVPKGQLFIGVMIDPAWEPHLAPYA